jgi:hypothetical protein
VSLDDHDLIVERGEEKLEFSGNDIRAIWFNGHRGSDLSSRVEEAHVDNERLRYRVDRNALGSPLRLNDRTYARGLGMRAPASIELDIPEGSGWFISRVGIDTDAAGFSQATFSILIDGVEKATTRLTAADPHKWLVVPVDNADKLTLKLTAVGEDPTGCLGDFIDASFITQP